MKKILINDNPWQTRIAITQENRLQNLFLSAHAVKTLERCYFKGIVTKVLPGIQTAFVNIGQERAGFLHISEIDRELAIQRMTKGDQFDDLEEEEAPRRAPIRRELDISKILREGEPILVQVNKEPVYEKGAKLTTCFTLPGRFLVLMPNIPRIGISKKIDTREERQKLRTLLTSNLPEGMGAIIRTSCAGHDEQEIIQDLQYLVQSWNEIQEKFKSATAAEKIFEDLTPMLAAVRDNLDDSIESIICDTQNSHSRIYKFVKQIAPEFAHRVKQYSGLPALFEKFDIEAQIEEALNKKVMLSSGGSIIVESAESMTVIDVNTGRYVGSGGMSMEDTIFKTNLEAAEEIVRQLRLRNIGGLIVIDFIDMAVAQNRQKLFKFFEKTLKDHDRFQSVVLRLSEFGLVQMTRKRSGKTLIQQMMDQCGTCNGLGWTKSMQTQTFAALRRVKDDLDRGIIAGSIALVLNPTMFSYITTVEYETILQFEREHNCTIMLISDEECPATSFTIQQKK